MDIVERLRQPWIFGWPKPPEMNEASDEIERLRAELARVGAAQESDHSARPDYVA